MGVITTGAHPALMWPGLKAIVGNSYKEHPLQWPDLFEQDTSDKLYEKDQRVTGLPLAPVKPEGEGVTYASTQQLYESLYTHVVYGLGFIVSMEELKFNLYMQKGKPRAQSLGFSLRQTEEIVHANIFNRAFNDSYTGGDGKEMCATDHPTPAGNQSNELDPAADISEAALEDMVIMTMNMQDDSGHRISLVPQSLHVAPANWFEANRIVKSVLQNDTANNASNVLRMLNVFPRGIMVNNYFDDADAYFIRNNCPRGTMHFSVESMSISQDNDFDTQNARTKGVIWFSCGWTDWRQWIGSGGA